MISRGHKIVLNTQRGGEYLEDAVNNILSCGIKLYGINKTPGQRLWSSSPKVYAHAYIDDKSIGVPTLDNEVLDWSAIRNELINKGFYLWPNSVRK
jgi:hypothetical protein